VILHVFANRSNIGDWLSARGIQALLAPRKVTELLCDEPFVAETLGRLAAAGPDDLVIIGGGGLFMDYFLPFWQGFAELARRVPFAIWGIGCCAMKRAESLPPRKLIAGIVRHSRLCVVRDELTRQWLAECDLPGAVPCPTLNVVEAGAPGHGVLHVDALDNVGAEVYEAMNREGARFAARSGRTFRSTNNLIPAGSQDALQRTLGHYAAADIVLSGRLHGCIIGLAMGRKVLAVSGDHKVESFMAAAGLGAWVLTCAESSLLPQRLEDLPGQRPPVSFLTQSRAENLHVADKIFRMLGGSKC
jgi:hypothetical protein